MIRTTSLFLALHKRRFMAKASKLSQIFIEGKSRPTVLSSIDNAATMLYNVVDKEVLLMFDRSQLLKGTLEGCILKLLEQEETYGYRIVELLSNQGFSGLSEGTIYPLLLRLERNGLTSAVFHPSPFGPSRKYFSLTDKGLAQLREFESEWSKIESAVENILQYKRRHHDG